MNDELYIDTETFCELPISVGAEKYARHCETMIFTFAIGDDEVDLWQPAKTNMPPALARALQTDCPIIAHNVGFDRPVIRHSLGITPRAERWHCTMVQAMAHSLPGKLELLCHLFGLSAGDSKVNGKDLIHLFCKPRPKNSKLRRATQETHPVEWEAFCHYAKQDIRAMRELHRNKLPKWNYPNNEKELALWHLDQRINTRGIAVDLDFSRAAVDLIEHLKDGLDEETMAITGGAVTAATQRDSILKHLVEEFGVSLPDLKASTIERRLDDPDLPEPVKELLRVRLASTKAGGKKHAVVLRSEYEGILRGLLRFCGAGRTARWSGQIVQPQNFMRPPRYLKGSKYDEAIAAIKRGDLSAYERPMEVIAGTMRGVLVPRPGKRYAVADLAAIEGRVLAWLAGEQWKLDAYARGEDLYKAIYARTFGIDVADVDEDQRQVGKVEDLSMGYQGAVGAFTKMGAGYGIELPEAEIVRIVKGWRKAHPATVSFWYDLEADMKTAINNPGQWFTCRRLRVRRDGAWMRIELPSGRFLCYPKPRINESGKIVYDGMNQYTRKWGPITTYGGKAVENVTQAVARDAMAESMPHIEQAGFDILLLVHDEDLAEVDIDSPLNGEVLAALMSADIEWAPGLPLAAVGHDLDRYRKA